ncbi:hypothetical protein PXW85_26750, partial [Klebsiella pneumoniae]|nr:hypothetical protein [Klebsiella pneumoniae]
SSAIGPVLGGTILHTLSWQWLFAINILPGTLALLLAVRALPRPLRYRSSSARAGCVKSLILRKQDKRENITKRYDSSASSAK